MHVVGDVIDVVDVVGVVVDVVGAVGAKHSGKGFMGQHRGLTVRMLRPGQRIMGQHRELIMCLGVAAVGFCRIL